MKIYRIETIDAWIKIKPRLLDTIDLLARLNVTGETSTSIIMNIENYLLNFKEDIYIGIGIEEAEIVSYFVLLKHIDYDGYFESTYNNEFLCCIAGLWCKQGYLSDLLQFKSILDEFAYGCKSIYWKSQRFASDKLLKMFNSQIKYICYEMKV